MGTASWPIEIELFPLNGNSGWITDFILSQDNPNARYDNKEYGLRFDRRFAIVRVEEHSSRTTRNEPFSNPARRGSKLSFNLGEGLSLGRRDVTVRSNSRSNTSAFVEIEGRTQPRLIPENRVRAVVAAVPSENPVPNKNPKAEANRHWTDVTGAFSLDA